MIRIVFRDYLGAFHWLNLKKRLNSNHLLMIVMINYMCLPLSELKGFTGMNLLHYAVLVFSLTLGIAAAVLFPMRLSKQLFLCPMRESERKSYIWCQYWIKTAVPTLCCLLGMIPLLSAGTVFFMQVLAEGAVLLMLMLTINIELPSAGFRTWKIFTEISGGIVWLILCCFETKNLIPAAKVLMWILFGWQLLFTVKMLTFLKPAVSTAMDYEKTMEVAKE